MIEFMKRGGRERMYFSTFWHTRSGNDKREEGFEDSEV